MCICNMDFNSGFFRTGFEHHVKRHRVLEIKVKYFSEKQLLENDFTSEGVVSHSVL